MRFVKYFLISVFFVLFGIAYSRELPRLKLWILEKIREVSKEKLPIEFDAKFVEFEVLPPGITILGVSGVPKKSLEETLDPFTARAITVTLGASALVAGRFEIGTFIIDSPKLNLTLKPKPKTQTVPAPFELPWNEIISLPVRKIVVKNAEVLGRIKDADFVFQLTHFGTNLEKTSDAARLEIFGPEIYVKRPSKPESLSTLGIATRIIAEKDALEISALKVTQGKSFIVARGVGRGSLTHFDWGVVNGRTVSHVELNEFTEFMKTFFPEYPLPVMKGDLSFEILARHQKNKPPLISAEINSQSIQIDQFKIGDIKSKLRYSADTLRSDEIRMTSAAGTASLLDVDLKTGKEYKISTRLLVEGLELHQLLIDLGVDDVPLHMDMRGRVPCEGTLYPKIHVECAGEMTGSQFWLKTEKEKNDPTGQRTIVALKSFGITSTLLVEKNKIIFPHGLLTIGDSHGEAVGEVDFEKGFKFNFHTSRLNFSDVLNLGELKFQGTTEVTGSTSGTGHTGVFDAQLKASDFWFEDYWTGNNTFDARYEKGSLFLKDILGSAGKTTYTAQSEVRLKASLQNPAGLTAKVNISKLELEDLIKVFSRKVNLPFNASGAGSATLEVSGPFKLSTLTYNLKSKVPQGIVAGEIFKDLQFDVHGVKGHAYADDVRLKKGDGTIKLTGEVFPTGIMNLFVAGRSLHLTDFEYMRTTAPGVEGGLTANFDLKDFILRPHVDISGEITQSSINQKPLDDSELKAKLTPTLIKANANIFKDRLKLDLTYPFGEKEDEPFHLNFSSTKWDFSGLLEVIGGANFKKDYETELTAKASLLGAHGGFWQSTGNVDIEKFFIRHGTSKMENSSPIFVRFSNGDVSVDKMQIDGDNTQLTVSGAKSKKDFLNFNINGRIDLSLLTFLTPFFKEMSGQLSVSTQIGGSTSKPDLLGSAFVTKGFFKVEALPHAFEDISADLLFSQTRALVNRCTGQFGGGQLSLGGTILFKDFRDIPAELTGDLIHATLSIPDPTIITKGNIHFGITGNWFPYLFKADYSIMGGSFTKNFGDENQDNLIKRSTYLPKPILQKDFSPVELEISTQFDKGMTVHNDMMDAEARGILQIKGDPRHPILQGEIDATSNGKVFFHETPFNITTARTRFTGSVDNNAVLYVLASTRLRDRDISLLVQGTQLKPNIELTSSPPMSEQSIISLLALGVTEETLEKENAGDQSAIQGYQAGGLILSQNPLQHELKRQLGVNVRLSQTVDDTKNVVMPRVVAEKQWTPQISTSYSHTIGDRVTRDVNVEYKLNRNFSVLGSYEGREYDNLAAPASQQQSNITQDIFGLDLQYQMEFK